jgi:hypothetical protein
MVTDKKITCEKQRAIVFGLTSNHIAAVATVLMDLRKLSPRIADVCVIIHDGKLGRRDQELLHNIFPCRFEVYQLPIHDLSAFRRSTIKRFSHMVFSKFECLRLLDTYSVVMWLDYDIVIQSDISDLMARGRCHARFLPGNIRVRDQLHASVLVERPIAEFDLDAEGVCGSTFVLFDTLPDYQRMYAFCYEALARYAEYLYLGEQGVLDFLIQRFGIRYDAIDAKKHTPHPSDELARDARIVHAYGTKKFWNGIHNAQWQANYSQWRRTGGSAIVAAPFWSRLRQKVRSWLQ